MSDDVMQEILRLIEQAKAEGRPIQFGESECCLCHADLGESWETLRIHTRDLTAYIRLCQPCSARFDLEAGIFQKVQKG